MDVQSETDPKRICCGGGVGSKGNTAVDELGRRCERGNLEKESDVESRVGAQSSEDCPKEEASCSKSVGGIPSSFGHGLCEGGILWDCEVLMYE